MKASVAYLKHNASRCHSLTHIFAQCMKYKDVQKRGGSEHRAIDYPLSMPFLKSWVATRNTCYKGTLTLLIYPFEEDAKSNMLQASIAWNFICSSFVSAKKILYAVWHPGSRAMLCVIIVFKFNPAVALITPSFDRNLTNGKMIWWLWSGCMYKAWFYRPSPKERQ